MQIITLEVSNFCFCKGEGCFICLFDAVVVVVCLFVLFCFVLFLTAESDLREFHVCNVVTRV